VLSLWPRFVPLADQLFTLTPSFLNRGVLSHPPPPLKSFLYPNESASALNGVELKFNKFQTKFNSHIKKTRRKLKTQMSLMPLLLQPSRRPHKDTSILLGRKHSDRLAEEVNIYVHKAREERDKQEVAMRTRIRRSKELNDERIGKETNRREGRYRIHE
jgi:hypothetical protein